MVFTFGLKEYGRNNEVVVRRGSTVEYKVKKLKYRTVGGHAAEDQNQIWTSSLSFISEE